jgi:hypothetical protein
MCCRRIKVHAALHRLAATATHLHHERESIISIVGDPDVTEDISRPPPPACAANLASSSTTSRGVAPTRSRQVYGSAGKRLIVLPGQHTYHPFSLDTARSLRFITDKGITAVLSVCNEFVPAEDPLLRLMHHRIRIEDAPTGVNLLAELPAACAFIHTVLSRGGKVLVHSVRGQNRAPAVVVAYRQWTPCTVLRGTFAHAVFFAVMQAMGLDVTNAAERVRKGKYSLVSPVWHPD